MMRSIRFYHPLPRFPSVSITGDECVLDCKHCKGHYLKNMPDASTPDKLRDFCIEHESNGGLGLLISGGSTLEGRVPLEPFLPTIKWIKENTDLILNLHTGVVDTLLAEEIASCDVDIVSVDLVGCTETLRNVYGLPYSSEEYMNTLYYLVDAGITHVAPHITVGLDYGKIRGEYRALEYASSIKPEVVVFLGLIPTKNTPMYTVQPPNISDIIGLIRNARDILPKTSISLGCMRSRQSKQEMEWEAIKAGADRIASSSRITEKMAATEGYKIKIIQGCCAIPHSYEKKFRLY